MQKMQIEISYQDQVDLENICTEQGLSYSEFFKRLLDSYRQKGWVIKEPIPEPIPSKEKVEVAESPSHEPDKEDVKEDEEQPKRRGRPPKAN